MSIRYAFVTLITSDAYLPGALTIAAALNDVHRPLPLDETVAYETVCLVTPEIVDITTIRLLRKAFDVVVGVEMIVPPASDTESLTLLGASSYLAF
jgi:glycogenin glucosyltransferase